MTCPNVGSACNCTGACMPKPPGLVPKMQFYPKLESCVDDRGHRFQLSASAYDTSVCERCGLIRRPQSYSSSSSFMKFVEIPWQTT